MVDGMGDADSQEYKQFCSLACQTYNLLRKRAGLVNEVMRMMVSCGNHVLPLAMDSSSRFWRRRTTCAVFSEE